MMVTSSAGKYQINRQPVITCSMVIGKKYQVVYIGSEFILLFPSNFSMYMYRTKFSAWNKRAKKKGILFLNPLASSTNLGK
jgi:hypothetical protein